MINGIRKMSVVDYPKFPSYVIFMGGCNMHCPFCHNRTIVEKETEVIEEKAVLNDLKERKNFLQAVVITGGEPTIHGEKLISLMKKIKRMGYMIKLDTNGTNPELLKRIIKLKLIDYIAMDIKNSFDNYEEVCGVKTDINKIKESIELIEVNMDNYEFRTTINKDMHSIKNINTIAEYVKDKNKLFFQPYRYSEEQIRDVRYTEFSEEELIKIRNKYNINVRI